MEGRRQLRDRLGANPPTMNSRSDRWGGHKQPPVGSGFAAGDARGLWAPAQPAALPLPRSTAALTMNFPETSGWKMPSKEQREKEQVEKSKSLLTCRAQRVPFPVPTMVTVVLRARLGLSFSVQGLS